MGDKNIRMILIISGRVQNVGFREKMQKVAKKLSLCGYVHNLPNGSVRAVIEGKKTKIQELVAWAKDCSSPVQVHSIIRAPRVYLGEFTSFEIR